MLRRMTGAAAARIAAGLIAPAAAQEEGGTFRSSLRTGCIEQDTLHTTCAHRLDETVLQGLVHIKSTGDAVQPMRAESWETPDGGKTGSSTCATA